VEVDDFRQAGGEGGDVLGRRVEVPHLGQFVVGEEVFAFIGGGELVAGIKIGADDGAFPAVGGVAVGVDRVGVGGVGAVPLGLGPAVVLALGDLVDFLPGIFADVVDVERICAWDKR